MSGVKTFAIGNRVILDGPRRWREGLDNPYWGGVHGHIVGTVTNVTSSGTIYVRWDNGKVNDYYDVDLSVHALATRELKDVITEVTQQDFINKSAIFSAYDVTTKIRELVNAKKLELANVPFEDVDGVLTQRVKHDDVRGLVRTLVAANPAYIASYNGEYIEYRTTVPTPIPVASVAVSPVVTVTPTGTTSTASTPTPSTATVEFVIRGYVKRKTNPTLKQIQSRLKKDAPTVREIATIVTNAGLRIDQRTPYYASVVTL